MNIEIGTPLATIGSILLVSGSLIALADVVKDAQNVSKGSLETSVHSDGINLIVTGLGLDLIAIPFAISANRHLKKSINIYNTGNHTGCNYSDRLHIGLSTNGLGLFYTF